MACEPPKVCGGFSTRVDVSIGVRLVSLRKCVADSVDRGGFSRREPTHRSYDQCIIQPEGVAATLEAQTCKE